MCECLICERIKLIKEGTNKYFVTELETGYVVIGDHQLFEGYTVFLSKEHVTELHFLEKDIKVKFLEEMSLVGEAVYNAFSPEKLNYELLGNANAHLHWHIFPRQQDDSKSKGPVWWTNKKRMYSDSVRPSKEKLEYMKERLLTELEKLMCNVESLERK